jgi:tellurite resistance protein TerC
MNEVIFFAVFISFIVGVLILDLGVFNKDNHEVSFKEAAVWSGIWVTLSIAFFFFLRFHGDLVHGVDSFEELQIIEKRYAEHVDIFPDNFELSKYNYNKNMSVEFITGYVIEYALSADNIFVIILIFTSFSVHKRYYKRVLFWGILGALVMRFIFIFAGSALIHRFEWILYVFGTFLLYTGLKLFFKKEEDEAIDAQDHPVVKITSKYLPVYPRYVQERFFIRREGKLMVTPLFVVLLIIEFTDLIFAVDSVPAVFSVTRDPYVVFFSNIFAILGLRSMFFFLASIMDKLRYLKLGLAFLLTFIGIKMLFVHWLKELGFQPYHSLMIILAILAISIIASLANPISKETEKLDLP